MKRSVRHLTAICCLGLFSVIVGCQSATDTHDDHGHSHDHSHTPKSLSAAIKELDEMWHQISKAMDEDDPKSAHDPLHEIGPLLKAMPDLAADTDLPESEWKLIKEQADKLFDAFGEIDATFHKKDGDKQAAYDAVKSVISAGIAALEAKLPLLAEDASNHEHHHDHGDEHEDHDDEHEDDDEAHENHADRGEEQTDDE